MPDLLEETRVHFLYRRKWMLERVERASSRSEWGRPDFDGPDPSSTDYQDFTYRLLSGSSPAAYPEGWTPRREAARMAVKLAIDTIRLAQHLLAGGYTLQDLDTLE